MISEVIWSELISEGMTELRSLTDTKFREKKWMWDEGSVRNNDTIELDCSE